MRALAVLCFAPLALVACGGEQGERPDAGANGLPLGCAPLPPPVTEDDQTWGVPDCHALDGYELSTIDDFETGAASGWYVNNDRSALQIPAPDTDPVFGEKIPHGRCLGVPGAQSQYAIHIVSGSLADYGGVFGRNLPRRQLDVDPCPIHACLDRPASPAPLGPCGVGMGTPNQPPAALGCITGSDASAYDGIVFWARKAPGSGSTIRLHVADVHTDDSNQTCECVSYTNQNDTSNGCDKFGTFRTLDSTFRAYFFPFLQMQQGGWGHPAPSIDTSGLFSLGIDYGRGPWDFWIDDIAYYRRKK